MNQEHETLRNYTDITSRVENLNVPVELLGHVNDYPIYQICLASSAAAPSPILITGGVHGDEPAGVAAALQFLERDNLELLKRFTFVLIPCINPYGYVHGTRENREGVDINRAFETAADVAEVAMVKKAIGQTQFAVAIDFHEDYDATGFYLYEGKRDAAYIGAELADAVKTIGPVDTEDPGEEAPEIATGVYKVASEWGTQGLAPYLLHFHSEHVIITETPTIWPLEQRIALHLGILDCALALC